MKPVNIANIARIGANIARVGDIKNRKSHNYQDIAGLLHSLSSDLKDIFEDNIIFTSVSKPQCSELKEIVYQVLEGARIEFENQEKGYDISDKVFPIERLVNLYPLLDKYSNVLESEMGSLPVFTVPARWAYSSSVLIEKADTHVISGESELFDGDPRDDYREAGRCLAYELPTAAGFHAARSVEGVLRRFFAKAAGGEAGDFKLAMGPLLKKYLGENPENGKGPRTPLIYKPEDATIRHIRDFAHFDRNPIMHPDAKLDMNDAKRLFDTAATTINVMISDANKWDQL